jgi:hypothetical protein
MPVTLTDEQWANIVAALYASSNGLAAMSAGASVAAKGLGEAIAVVDAVMPGQIDELAKAQQADKPEG